MDKLAAVLVSNGVDGRAKAVRYPPQPLTLQQQCHRRVRGGGGKQPTTSNHSSSNIGIRAAPPQHIAITRRQRIQGGLAVDSAWNSIAFLLPQARPGLPCPTAQS